VNDKTLLERIAADETKPRVRWRFEILKDAWFPEKVDPAIRIYRLRETEDSLSAQDGPTMDELKEIVIEYGRLRERNKILEDERIEIAPECELEEGDLEEGLRGTIRMQAEMIGSLRDEKEALEERYETRVADLFMMMRLYREALAKNKGERQ